MAVQVNDFVKIRKTSEKGRFTAILRAHDGTTLLVKTPTGDRHIDLPPGPFDVSNYLAPLPKTAA